MAIDLALVREAFHLSGEKHFGLARRLYPLVFGDRWSDAILAFAYLKCLDNLVDEDPDRRRALATLARQAELIARAYAGAPAERGAAPPERFGLPVFARDRRRGGRLRARFETIVASMEFDTRRRGVQLDAAALDRYVVELGGSVLHLFAELAAPGVSLPPGVVGEGSRAYLYADALMDLSHDLAFGVVNVPREDADWQTWIATADDAPQRAWVAARVPQVLGHFTRLRGHLGSVQPRTLRIFLALYLAAKRRKLRRFLASAPAALPPRPWGLATTTLSGMAASRQR